MVHGQLPAAEHTVSKTRELVINNSKTNSTAQDCNQNTTCINNQSVAIVDSVSWTISWTLSNTPAIPTNATNKDYQPFTSSKHFLLHLPAVLAAYIVIQPILLYSTLCFFTILPVSNSNKLIRITHNTSKMIGLPMASISNNNKAMRALTITQDPGHPLYPFHCYHLYKCVYVVNAFCTDVFMWGSVQTGATAWDLKRLTKFLPWCGWWVDKNIFRFMFWTFAFTYL